MPEEKGCKVITPRPQIVLDALGKGNRFSLFGAGTYAGNVKQMAQEGYQPSVSREGVYLVSLALEHPEDQVLAEIVRSFNNNWIQLGRIVRGREGVYVNPPKDESGEFVLDERRLIDLTSEDVEGVRYGENGLAFAPYDSFKQGVQSANDFAKSGLAKAIEFSKSGNASKLADIAKKQRRKEVNVWGFNRVDSPVLKVLTLYSYSGRLHVDGGDWDDDSDGCAFGVLS